MTSWAAPWCPCLSQVVLRAELPSLHRAFVAGGLPPALLAMHWLRRAFVHVLDPSAVRAYVCACVALGPDYQVYFSVAVLRHLAPRARAAAAHGRSDGLLALLSEAISGFELEEHAPFLQRLETTYRALCLRNYSDAISLRRPGMA